MLGCSQIDVTTEFVAEVSNYSQQQRLMSFLNDDLSGLFSESGITISEQTSLSHIPFWAAVARLSGDLGQVDAELRVKTGPETTEPVADEAILDVLRNPNPLMTELVFRETLYKDMYCWGNGLAEIQRDGAGRPIQLTPLIPQHTWLDWDDDGFMWYITNIFDGGKWRTFKIPPGDIYHLKWLTWNGLWGYTIISLLRNSLGFGLGITKHGNRLFANQARPDGILTTDALLKDETLRNIRTTWNNYHQGLDNVGRTAVLHNGLKYQAMSMSNEDAQFIESKKLDREEWATVFQMPSHFLNVDSRAPFATTESTYRWYLNHTLGRHLTNENQESRDKLLIPRQRRRGMFFTHDVSRFLQANINERAAATSQVVGGPVMTRQEARVRFWNMNPEPAEGQEFLERSTGAPINEGRSEERPQKETQEPPNGAPLTDRFRSNGHV